MTADSRRGSVSRWLGRDVLFRVGHRRLSLTTLLLLLPVVLGFVLPAGVESPVPLCFGYWFSGVPCHLCGMTRAVTYLCHGDLADAVRYHPAVFAVFPALVMGLISSAWRDFGGRSIHPAWRRVTNIVGWASLMFILGFGTFRALSVMFLGWEPW